MPDFIYRFTSLSRPLDLKYPTNVAISLLMVISAAIAALFYLLIGVYFSLALVSGALVGIGVFLTWAIAREVDPDNPLSAFAAAGITLLGAFVFGVSDVLAMILLLVGLRILNRSVGPRATIIDSTVLLVLAGVMALRLNWIYPLITANIFLLDSSLPQPHRRQIGFGLAALVVTGIGLLLGGWQGPQHSLSLYALLGIAVIVLFVIMNLLSTEQLTSKSDITEESLSLVRVAAAQIMLLLTCVFIAVWYGTVGVIQIFPLLAVLLGVPAYRLLRDSFSATPPIRQTESED